MLEFVAVMLAVILAYILFVMCVYHHRKEDQ